MRRFISRENSNNSLIVKASEITEAEHCLFYISQRMLDNVKERKSFMTLNAKIDAFGLYRASGRIDNFPVSDLMKHPIILHKDCKLVEYYLIYKHRIMGHTGFRVVLTELYRKGIYIIGGRKMLKSIAAHCIFCRTRRGKLLTQQMGQLPAFRGNPYSPVFHTVALDYFGPIKAKITRFTVVDCWILIVTCTTSRAIHLEIVDTSSSISFITAWRRFVTTRGVHPKEAFSDRGNAFVGAHRLREWIDSWNKEIITCKLHELGTEFQFRWEFNIPSASHMNGVVESLIRSCRKGLDALANYHKRKFTVLEWQTIISEVCFLVNSRPLFSRFDDPLSGPLLTANDILYPYGQPMIPQPNTIESSNLLDVLNICQQRVQVFWETWMNNMPENLIPRSKWFHSRANLKVGDLILLIKDGIKRKFAPRGVWRRGVVKDVFPGADGLVRKCSIWTLNENGNKIILERPIHKMCLIATCDELQHGFNSK